LRGLILGEHRVLLVKGLDKLLLANLFFCEVGAPLSLVGKSQDLDIVDLLTVEAHHQLWVYHFIELAVVGDTVIVLLVSLLVDSRAARDHAVVFLVALVENLLSAGHVSLGIEGVLTGELLLRPT
jgi:hypothetical protein